MNQQICSLCNEKKSAMIDDENEQFCRLCFRSVFQAKIWTLMLLVCFTKIVNIHEHDFWVLTKSMYRIRSRNVEENRELFMGKVWIYFFLQNCSNMFLSFPFNWKNKSNLLFLCFCKIFSKNFIAFWTWKRFPSINHL